VKLEVITIGSELLLGQIVDTNAAELGRALAGAGAEVVRHLSVADRPEAIRAAVGESLQRTGFVITTGGLGPTRDDMTKLEVAALFGKPLRLDEGVLRSLEERFRRLGRPMPAVNRTQAEVPEGATVLPNPRGTAPGLWVEDAQGRVVVMLHSRSHPSSCACVVRSLCGQSGHGVDVWRSMGGRASTSSWCTSVAPCR